MICLRSRTCVLMGHLLAHVCHRWGIADDIAATCKMDSVHLGTTGNATSCAWNDAHSAAHCNLHDTCGCVWCMPDCQKAWPIRSPVCLRSVFSSSFRTRILPLCLCFTCLELEPLIGDTSLSVTIALVRAAAVHDQSHTMLFTLSNIRHSDRW